MLLIPHQKNKPIINQYFIRDILLKAQVSRIIIMAPGHVALLMLAAIFLLLSELGESLGTVAIKSQNGAPDISVANLTTNIRAWRKDMAVMFYAPWCKYCKQLRPSWDQIAKISEANTNLQVGVFDCDSDTSSTEVCQALGVDRYPSIYFVGYGDFNQAKQGSIFAKSEIPRTVRYNADLYPDHILDWVQMLAGISAAQRGVDSLTSLFSRKAGVHKRIEDLQGELDKVDYRMRLYADELERYKADEIFAELPDNGDPFPLLSTIDVKDDRTLPFRVCLVEYTNEYCRVHKQEPYCQTFLRYCNTPTSKEAMSPEVCRPAKCPMETLGCRVVSACMQADTVKSYQEALGKKIPLKS